MLQTLAYAWPDNLIMRLLDVLLAFPFLLLAIVSVLGPGLLNAMLGIAIVSVPAYARVIRASVLTAREEDYVLAARTIGAKPGSILFSHIMPNSVSPLIVQATLGIGTAILDVAALSFPGLVIMLTVLGFNLLGDGLRDALDPRLKR